MYITIFYPKVATWTLSLPFDLSPNLLFPPSFDIQLPSTPIHGTGGDKSGSEKMVRILGPHS